MCVCVCVRRKHTIHLGYYSMTNGACKRAYTHTLHMHRHTQTLHMHRHTHTHLAHTERFPQKITSRTFIRGWNTAYLALWKYHVIAHCDSSKFNSPLNLSSGGEEEELMHSASPPVFSITLTPPSVSSSYTHPSILLLLETTMFTIKP